MNTLKNNILHIVEKNNIRMIPKWQFLLYSMFGMIFALFCFFSLVFIISLLAFLLSKYGFIYMPFFGFQEMIHTLFALPFLLVVIAIVLLFITETLARHYTFAFKKPLFITLLSITGTAAVTGLLVSFTPIHHGIRNFARMHNMGSVMHMYDRPIPFNKESGELTVLRGLVISTSSQKLIIRLYDESEVEVTGTTTNESNQKPNFNDEVVMLGDMENGVFKARQLRILPPSDDPFDPRTLKKEMKIRG